MSKKVAIVVGSQDSGKSTTINIHLKPKLGIKEKAYNFWKKQGYIMSQSIEESGIDLEKLLSKCLNRKFVVLASRPEDEKKTKLNETTKILENNGFNVKHFYVYKSKRTNSYQILEADNIITYFQQ